MPEFLNTKAEFDQAIKDTGDKLMVVDFTASWCGPCKLIGPKFEAMSVEFTDVVFYKVDVDHENYETSLAEGVSVMPTFKCFRNGKKIDVMVGANEAKLRSMIKKYK